MRQTDRGRRDGGTGNICNATHDVTCAHTVSFEISATYFVDVFLPI